MITGITLTDVANGDSISREEWENGSTVSGVLEGYDPATDVGLTAADLGLNIGYELDDSQTGYTLDLSNLQISADGTFTLDVDFSSTWVLWEDGFSDWEDGFIWFEASYDGLDSERVLALFDPNTNPGVNPINDVIGTSEENTTPLTGNVLDGTTTNPIDDNANPGSFVDQNPTGDALFVSPDSVEYVGATAQLGSLNITANGNYTYTLDNAAAQHLSSGQIGGDNFRFDVTDTAGNYHSESLRATVIGQNDQSTVADMTGTALEGGDFYDNNTFAPTPDGRSDVDFGDALVFEGKLGKITDVDVNDEHQYELIGDISVTSDTVGSEHFFAANNDNVDFDPEVFLNPTTGEFELYGDFDALGQSETATVTFQYQAVEYYDKDGDGDLDEVGRSELATATITVTGTNDQVFASDDQIFTFRDLPTGNIYDAVLANDTDEDVNDDMYIYDTLGNTLHGDVYLNMADEVLTYTPAHGELGVFGDAYRESFQYGVSDREDHHDLSSTSDTAWVDVDVLSANFVDSVDNYDSSSDGNDLIANFANDWDDINGHAGHDLLYGGSGQDIINGGADNDVLVGGAGADMLNGGADDDIYVFNKGDGSDVIEDASGFDMVAFGATVNRDDIAFFLDKGADGLSGTADDVLQIKYSKNDEDDIVYIKGGIDTIESIVFDDPSGFIDGMPNADFFVPDGIVNSVTDIIAAITTYNATPGNTAANNIYDVQHNDELMTMINGAWA